MEGVNQLDEVEYSDGPQHTDASTHGHSEARGAQGREPTPLPKFQLFVVFLTQFAEPITAVVIYPFVNQFVRDTGITGGDDRKTGYYAGVIESTFFFAEAATVFQWGWMSDCIGRRPVLLLGPLGLTFAMMSFGLSTTFWPMVASRCLQGVFNGNIGVAKTVTVELTDSTNIGDAFAMMPLVWSVGITIAPIIGGVLSNPATRWPGVFEKISLFVEHPYFLPCLVSGTIAFLTFLVGFFGLKETNPSRTASTAQHRDEERRHEVSTASSSDNLLGNSDTPSYGTTASTRCPSPTSSEPSLSSFTKPPDSNPPTLHSTLSSPKMQITLINCIFFIFTEMCYAVLLPLIFSTSISTGGLGLSPYHIGVIMGTWGLFNAFVQISLLGRFIRTYGAISVFKFAYSCFAIALLTFPFSTYLAWLNGGVGVGTCVIVAVQLVFASFGYMAYGAIHVIVAQSTPKSILGSVNGIVQMMSSIVRTIAPTFASSLFSMSIQQDLLGGYMVYVVLYTIALVGIGFSRILSEIMRDSGRSA